MAISSRTASRRWITAIATLAMLAYILWMIGPYLRSIVVRDAAVTTWIYEATAPIVGVLDQNPLLPGQRVPATGRIATVHNERVDRTPLDIARTQLAEAEALLASLRRQAAALGELIAQREARADAYAQIFLNDLESEIALATAELAALDRQLSLESGASERSARLARTGNLAQSAADLAAIRLAEIERERVIQERLISSASIRRDAARKGVFLLRDGSNPDWAFRDIDPLRVEELRLKTELVSAELQLGVARARLKAAEEFFDSSTLAGIQAPPGAMVWNLEMGPGSAVAVGTRVATWIDCAVMLVDAPVSDAEGSLLKPGTPAEVVLEGETAVRRGQVVLVRGAAATLGASDLVAIAKGRHPGIGHVIIQIPPTPQDLETCPVGRAAYVDFPGVGIIDILRVRLRM